MSSRYGEILSLSIFGQSHSAAIGMTLEGIPAGKQIDTEQLRQFLARRAPGRNPWSTSRREADLPEFIAGLVDGRTCGTPITALIRNTDTRSSDYEEFRNRPRPGHADYTAHMKYHGFQDHAGGGHFSGRMTAPLCIAGGICVQLLKEEGIEVISRILSVADVWDEGELTGSLAQKEFPVVSDEKGELMKRRIEEAAAQGDSVGGIIECSILNLPPGIGDPMFSGMENRIAAAVFAIPAVKGIEFGAGFQAAAMKGSENNDPFEMREGRVMTKSNHCGGILGGITNGMPVTFRAAFKPTPSIAKPQQTVDLQTGQETQLRIRGRHDPCIVLRALPCVEAAAAIAVYDALLAGKTKN